MADVCVIGAGGHAKVVIATLLAAGHRIAAAYDDDPARWGATILGAPIRPAADLEHAQGAAAIIAVGSNAARKRLAKRFHHLCWITAVHPGAIVHPSVRVGPGTIVFAGAVVQPDTVLGSHVIVNTSASVDHDCALADYVHVAPGVHLAGQVTLDEGVLMGIGAVAIPDMRVGAWSTVGAGAVVVRPIGPGVTAIGAPACARPAAPPPSSGPAAYTDHRPIVAASAHGRADLACSAPPSEPRLGDALRSDTR